MNKKRYSIDDLGKFDGSKMTIKVNGKQIYPQKRYAIVSVGKYGSCVEEFVCSGICKKCNYGDTKEQLINKITTALRRTWLNEDNQSFREVAKEIVEFLGVVE